MKKIVVLLILSGAIYYAAAQKSAGDLPAEFKDVVVQAFQKVSPATKQWFADAAKQHPAGPFDTAWARKKLRERFTKEETNAMDGILMAMMAYMKMVNKESKENKEMQKEDKRLELTSKENKLKVDNEKIDQGKKEADEKASNMMDAANRNLWIGLINGTVQTTGNKITSI